MGWPISTILTLALFLSFSVSTAARAADSDEDHLGKKGASGVSSGPLPIGRDRIETLRDMTVTAEVEVMERFIDRFENTGGTIRAKSLQGPNRLTLESLKKGLVDMVRRESPKITDAEIDAFWEQGFFWRAQRRLLRETYATEIQNIQKAITFDQLLKMIRSSGDVRFRLAIDAVTRDPVHFSRETIARLIAEGDKKGLPSFDKRNPPKDPEVSAAAQLLAGLRAHLGVWARGGS